MDGHTVKRKRWLVFIAYTQHTRIGIEDFVCSNESVFRYASDFHVNTAFGVNVGLVPRERRCSALLPVIMIQG